MSGKQYKCTQCEKEYNSYMGLWKHKKNKHTDDNKETIINEPADNEISKYNTCKYCNKVFNNPNHRWRHEKKNCKLNKQSVPNAMQTINNTNIQTQNNNTIHTQNNNITNIQTQNIINIQFNKLGSEDISILTQDEIEEIINNGLSSIIKLIEFINFNNAHPQNHTFCTTNLNNAFVSTLNTDTQEVETNRKADVYDKVLFYALQHINLLKKKIIDKKKRRMFKEKILELEKNIYGQVQYKKIFIEQLKLLSYNKRAMIENTWAKYISLII
jgi:hypothetical protein